MVSLIMEEAATFLIRPIEKKDDPDMARVIRTVMPEFGACGPGFAINDPEVDFMSRAYAQPRAAYFVVCKDSKVMGGAGIAPLEGGDEFTCELRKMYLLAQVRGIGAGQALMDACLRAAREKNFQRCYLETLKNMTSARRLYEKNGFHPLPKPMGGTGHFGCDCWYAREL